MIVCDLTHAYHSKSGGIRTIINNRREYIINNTEDDHVLVIPGNTDNVTSGDQWTTIQIKAPEIPRTRPYRFFPNPWKLLKALRDTRPDVVSLHTAYMPFEYWSALRYRKETPDSILTAHFHTDFSEAYVGTPLRNVTPDFIANPIERLAEKYIRKIYRRCDISFANSGEQSQRLESLGVEGVVPLSLGVDLSAFHPDKRDANFREELGLEEEVLLLSFAGRLHPEKRILVMLEAVKKLNEQRPACLVMTGEGPLREELKALEAAGAPIRLLPYQQTAEALARILASTDIYFSAGPHETFGLSVVEAQACCLPVVGVNAGALIERVTPEIGRLAKVDDPNAMVEALLVVENKREEMGRLARKHVAERFSWKVPFDRQFALFRKALGLPMGRNKRPVVAEAEASAPTTTTTLSPEP